mmetsp:Transcript_2255/g.5626  ORF Transcript_2255/g.5626 Transcript_2255/m.5626 type:complete len:222 (-) Transcript_2255:3-668(-)
MSSKTTRSRRKVSICSRKVRLAAMAWLKFCKALSNLFSMTRICLATAFALSRDALMPPFFAISPRIEKIFLPVESSLPCKVPEASVSPSRRCKSVSLWSFSLPMLSKAMRFSGPAPEDDLVSFSSDFILLFSRDNFSMAARCFLILPCESSAQARLSFSKTRNFRCNSAISSATGLASSSFFFLNIILSGTAVDLEAVLRRKRRKGLPKQGYPNELGTETT